MKELLNEMFQVNIDYRKLAKIVMVLGAIIAFVTPAGLLTRLLVLYVFKKLSERIIKAGESIEARHSKEEAK